MSILVFMIDTNNFWNWKRHNALQSIIHNCFYGCNEYEILPIEDYGQCHLKLLTI